MKRSKLLLAAGIIGTVYLIYLISHFTGAVTSSSGAEALGASIATALVTPHMVCVGIAVIFNWLGWALKARWAALVAGILYAVSIVCMFMYAMFVVLEMIFCFVAFAKMKAHQENSEKTEKADSEITE
jgi:uncharacterized membrane protein